MRKDTWPTIKNTKQRSQWFL